MSAARSVWTMASWPAQHPGSTVIDLHARLCHDACWEGGTLAPRAGGSRAAAEALQADGGMVIYVRVCRLRGCSVLKAVQRLLQTPVAP